MNTFAFQTKYTRKKAYQKILQSYQKHASIGDTVKISSFLIVIIVCFILNIIYINLSSTRGYFLRQANQRYNSATFDYEITKNQLMKVRQINRETTKNLEEIYNTTEIKSENLIIPNTQTNNNE